MKAVVRLTVLTSLMAAAAMPGCRTNHQGRRAVLKSFPVLNVASAKAQGISMPEMRKAIKLANTKCVRCHRRYDPTAYEKSDWQGWMGKMARKAHLTPGQRELLSRYFVAVRAAQR